MEQQKLQYVIEILKQGDAQGAIKELQGLETQGGKAADSMGKLASTAKIVVGLFAGGMLFRDAIRAFEDKERAVRLLDGSLMAAGKHSAEYRNELRLLAEETGKAAGVQDELILKGQAVLVQYGAMREEMPRLTRLMMDMSAAGHEVGQSANIIGAAIKGEFAPAVRAFKLDIDESATRGAKLESVLKQLEGRFGGFAAVQAKTTSGMRELNLQLENFKEELGKTLAGGISPITHEMARILEATNEWMADTQRAGPVIVGATTAIGVAVAALSAEYAALAVNAARAKVAMMFGGLGKGAGGLFALGGASLAAGMALESTSRGVMDAEAADVSSEAALAGQQRGLMSRLLESMNKAVSDGSLAESKANDLRAQLERTWARTQDVVIRHNALMGVYAQLGHGGVSGGVDPARLLDPELAKLAMGAADNNITLLNQYNYRGYESSLRPFDQQKRTPMGLAYAAMNEKQATLNQLQGSGAISMGQWTAQSASIMAEYESKMAEISKIGIQYAKEANSYRLSERTIQLEAIKAEYEKRQQMIAAYYETEIRLAQGNSDVILNLEQERTQTMKNLEAQREESIKKTSESYQMVQDMGMEAARMFSTGMSSALVGFISGTKNAKEAFSDFAASFLQSVSQMILQTIILKAVQSALGWGRAASGGFYPSGSNPMEGGAMMAAIGVTAVDSPTYFPKFNVMAGEAGREMLAVFARPKLASIGGVDVVTGSVRGQNMMLANMDQVQKNGLGGGKSEVLIRLEPGLRAEIVDAAIEGSVVRVVNDLSQDTATSSAVKRLVK
jgi:hypothetical protein